MNGARRVAPFVAGVLFAVGLGIAGMTDPRKVIGFLDVFGNWDASLAFVMAGGIATHLPFVRLARRPGVIGDCGAAAAGGKIVDAELLAGAAIFGVGWGLGGYCPGPALVASATRGVPILSFVLAMLLGAGLGTAWERLRHGAAADALPS